MENIDLRDIHISELKDTPDLRPFYSEDSVFTAEAKTYTPEDLARLKYIEFPGVGPCISAVIYSSEKDDVFALHIQPNQTPEKINQEIKKFIEDPKYPGKIWKLDYVVRKNPKDDDGHLGSDSAKGNLINLNNLADTEDHFPGKFDKVNVIYVEVLRAVDNFGWNHQDHFTKVVPVEKRQWF